MFSTFNISIERNLCVMKMDFQVVPETKLTEKQRKESEEVIRKFVQEHNGKVQAHIKQLKAAGYSDQEIEESFAF